MIGDDGSDDERGQAYTLEGIIGAMILLTAVLMALNSAVLLPSTSGTIDRGVQSDVGQQASDVLRIADEDGNLSSTLRCWDTSGDGRFNGSSGAEGAYRNGGEINNSLGTMLTETFSERYSSYTMKAVYRPEEGENSVEGGEQPVIEQGNALRKSITVSHTVTLYEDQTLTSSCTDDSDPPTLREAHDENYPVPPATSDSNPIYNVVEVRLTIIW